MEQRISLVTLGVTDLARSRAFYRALGWRGQEVEETVFFQAGGLAIVLWDRGKLAADCGLDDARAGGFDGIALAHNVRSDREVDELLGTAERAGGTVTRPAATSVIGFYSGVFTESGRARLGDRPQPRLRARRGRDADAARLRPGVRPGARAPVGARADPGHGPRRGGTVPPVNGSGGTS
ncbi:VOC family protein [Pseudonocardia ammonioxydans]|uniref:VOC family protein n=1 Tax=Pseudonocardia ammonioxydans TaxID=260086 RepID=UPI001C434AB4|nr:VOC family protein [Pseudonocardia ammonioxydans]